jgi:alpha-aminoadipate carrier protein LysW
VRNSKAKCSECEAEIEIPEDVIPGEIVSCPDCGLEFEVQEVKGDCLVLQAAEKIGEDWGE